MELKFIWIENYRIIENLGINFNHSGKHKFEFSNLKINLLPNICRETFFGENITGVTAIAGQNGSGKSSVCEAVLLSTATYTNGSMGYESTFKGIVCYGNHIFIHQSLKIDNTEALVEANYVIQFFDESPFEKMKHEWRDTFTKGGFVYYSNFLDTRTDIDAVNLVNISTQTSLRKSYLFSTSYPQLSSSSFPIDENRNKDKHGPTQIHELVDGNSIVRFYLNFSEFLPFVNPNILLIKSTYSGNNKWLNLDKIKLDDKQNNFWRLRNILDIEKKIFNTLFDQSLERKMEEKPRVKTEIFKTAIKSLYRFNIKAALSLIDNILPEYDDFYAWVFESTNENLNISSLFKLYDTIVDAGLILDEQEFSPAGMANYYEDVADWRFYLIENIYLPNNAENRKILKSLIDLEAEILRGDGSFRRVTNSKILSLSSGENSFITFFARIFDVIERHRSGHYEKDKLILFIDEAEVAFHPAWKRIFFKKLIDFLVKFNGEYKFQIILTTHSPYLLSDLPSDNVILLKRNKEGKTEILNSSDYKTFGANIHELLATSFFLEDGFMGEFAKNKIEHLISFLNDENQDFTPELAKQLILLIGDDIISDRLMDMYNEKFRVTEIDDESNYTEWLKAELIRVNLKKE